MVTFTGIIPSVFGFKCYCPLMLLQANTSMIETSVLPVEFYYRYYTLKKDKSPTIIRAFLWFFSGLILCSMSAVVIWTKFCPAEMNPNSIDYSIYWHPELPVPQLLVWQLVSYFKSLSKTDVPFYRVTNRFIHRRPALIFRYHSTC